MKKNLTIFLLFFSSSMIAQSDSSKLKLVFNFINSSEFRISFKNNLSRQIETGIISNNIKNRKKYIKQRWQDEAMWTDESICFMPLQYYLEDTAVNRLEKILLMERRLNKVSFEMKYFYWTNKECSIIYLLKPSFKNEQIIELEYYPGSYSVGFKLGVSYTLHFEIIDNISVKFISYQVFINN